MEHLIHRLNLSTNEITVHWHAAATTDRILSYTSSQDRVHLKLETTFRRDSAATQSQYH